MGLEQGLQALAEQVQGRRRLGGGESGQGDAGIRLGQGRGIIHAIPHEGHHAALRLQFLDSGPLVRRAAAAPHLGDAQCPAHALRRLRTVSAEQVQGDASVPEGLEHLRGLGAHPVRQHKHPLEGPVVRQPDHRCAFRCRRGGEAQPGRAAQPKPPPLDDPLHAAAGMGPEPFNGRQRQGFSRLPDAPGDRMFRIPLQGRRQTQHFAGEPGLQGQDVDDLGATLREGARLVQHHVRHGRQPFHGGSPPDQQPLAGRRTQGRGHGHGCGQAQGAGAGDDQHRNGRAPSLGEGAGVEPPEGQRQSREGKDGRHEHGGNPVCEVLDAGPASLRFGHLGRELGQPGVPPRTGHFDHQGASVHHGPREHRRSRRLRHRHRLPRQQRLGHVRLTAHHRAIHRNGAAGRHLHPVARLQHSREHQRLLALGIQLEGHRRGQRQERLERIRGPMLRPGFQVLAHQQEGHERRRRFEGWMGCVPQQFRKPIEPRNPCPEGHQGIHGGFPVAELLEGIGEEHAAGAEDHHAGEDGLEQARHMDPNAQHGQQEGQGEQPGGHHAEQPEAQFDGSLRRIQRLGDEAIAAIRQSLLQVRLGHPFGLNTDLLRGQVHLHLRDTRHRGQGLLHPPHAAGAGHALHAIGLQGHIASILNGTSGLP